MNHGLDTDSMVCFYEHEFYVLSNFSAFQIEWRGKLFPTSEHAYQSEKFAAEQHKEMIRKAPSAHEAFKRAELLKDMVRPDWPLIRIKIMKAILTAKVSQHKYVYRKLMETGDRLLIENSWRDSFWGWGPNKTGANQLGRLWMEIRKDLRESGEILHRSR